MASVNRAANRPDSANAQIDRVMTLIGDHGYEPAMLGIVAYQCALLGRGRDVDAVARLTHARARADDAIDQGSVAFVDGVADLAHHRPDSALAALRRADAFPWNLPRMMLRAEAFNALGQRDSARTVLVAANGARQFGSEGEDDWLRSAVLLGDALLEAHDTAGATRAYQSLLKQWRDAPGTTPDVALASRRLTAIAAHSGRH
jgi:predicted negative regulator of RcsB-dependent stress response